MAEQAFLWWFLLGTLFMASAHSKHFILQCSLHQVCQVGINPELRFTETVTALHADDAVPHADHTVC